MTTARFPHDPARVHCLLAALLLGAGLPLAAVAVPAPPTAASASSASAASQPKGPTIGSQIATKCKEMTGDERTSCERDVRHSAAERRAAHHHAHRASAPQ